MCIGFIRQFRLRSMPLLHKLHPKNILRAVTSGGTSQFFLSFGAEGYAAVLPLLSITDPFLGDSPRTA